MWLEIFVGKTKGSFASVPVCKQIRDVTLFLDQLISLTLSH